MKLDRIEIKNFRSIQEITLEFPYNCQVLVGINESGKSNILRAISLLSEDVEPNKFDLREPTPDESPVQDSYVKGYYTFDKEEHKSIYNRIKDKLLTDKAKIEIVSQGTKDLSLEFLCKKESVGIYNVQIETEEKRFFDAVYVDEDDYTLIDGWKKVVKGCPDEILIEEDTNNPRRLNQFLVVNTNEYPDIDNEYLEDLDLQGDLADSIIGGSVQEEVAMNIHELIFWRYDEKNLLPSEISINDFISNPNSCLPLKHMFRLAEITNIPEKLISARDGRKNALPNLLESVAAKNTDHFKNVWKEYATVQFELVKDGEYIKINIKEKTRSDFSDRSDGFKRFVTFLLMISAKVKSGLLEDSIILIDEPEISLHPSGAKYLRNELIEVAKKNIVVYSTHSIFMIDRDNIGRHLIVEKNDEKTKIAEASEDNVVDEDVLNQALGYSFFESLRPVNLVFEGWRDKTLYQTAIKRVPSAYAEIKPILKDLGVCHGNGVKNIRNVAGVLELAQRECIILSDSDRPAKRSQSEYIKQNNYGVWKRYDELDNSVDAITGEDFIKDSKIIKGTKEIIKRNPGMSELTEADIPNNGKLKKTLEWMNNNSLTQEQIEEETKLFKTYLFENLTTKEIEENFYKLLKALSDLVNDIQSGR